MARRLPWKIGLAALGLVTANEAEASCRFPEGTLRSSESIASAILESVSVVGFGILSSEPRDNGPAIQVVQIVHAFKGRRGRYVMDSGFRGRDPDGTDRYLVTASTGRLEADPGDVVFIALIEREQGAIVGECTQQLLNAAPLAEIATAVSDLAARRP